MKKYLLAWTYFYIIVVFVCTGAYSMNLSSSQSYAVMPSITYTVGSFLLVHKMHLFDHDMICSLGVANKEWEHIVKSVASNLKKCLASKIPEGCSGYKESTIVWHKYGTAWGKKCMYTCDDGRNALSVNEKKMAFHLDSIYWHFGDIETYTGNVIYGTEKTVKNIIHPKFNENGDFCCYSISTNITLWNKSEQVVEYCLTKDKKLYSLYSSIQILPCGLRLKRNKGSWIYCVLSHFLSFPFLLECFLNSKVVEESSIFTKIYSLKDAIIPHSYQECIPVGTCGYQSFHELPKQIRKEIIEHYKQQQAQNDQSASKKRRTLKKNIFWK